MEQSNQNNDVNNSGQSVQPNQPNPESQQYFTDSDIVTDPSGTPIDPANLPQPEQPKPKKKWPIIIIVAILLALVAGAVAYFVIGQDTSESSNNEQANSTTQTVNKMYFQNDISLSSINTANKSVNDDLQVPEGASIIAISEDAKTAIFMTISGASSDTEVGNLVIGKATSDGSETVFTSKYTTSEFTASPSVSSDLQNIAFYANETAGDNGKIFTAKLDSSNLETVLVDEARTEIHGPLRPILWSDDNSKVFYETASCYNCDGPVTANVWRSNIETKSFEQIFTQPAGTNAGSATPSPDGKSIAISVTNSDVGGTFEDVEAQSFSLYVLNTETSASEKVYSENVNTEGFQEVSGWSSDSSQVLVAVGTISKPTDAGQIFDYTFNRFDAVNAQSGASSPIPIELGFEISNSSSIKQAYAFDNNLFFIVIDEQVLTATTYDILSLPLGDGESAISTLADNVTQANLLNGKTITE